MKTACIVILAVWIPQVIFAQLDRKDTFKTQLVKGSTTADTTASDQREFDYAYDLWEEQPALSLSAFKDFVERYPESSLIPRAIFNIGELHYRIGQDSAARAILTQVVAADYDEMESNSLMEPYALYKHRACRILAELCLRHTDYDEAAEYIHLFDKVYPYHHFCGNEWQAYDYYRDWMLARVYEGQGKTSRAIQTLVPDIAYTGLASNEYIIEYLEKILGEHYSSEQIQHEVSNALTHARVKTKKGIKTTTLTLFGADVTFDHYDTVDQNSFIARHK